MAKLSRMDILAIKHSKKMKEERDTGYGSKGRRSAFANGVGLGTISRMWGGVSNIPKWIFDTLPKPPISKTAREDYHLGILWGRKR